MVQYFAYGSNMNPERMLQRGVEFTRQQHACLCGYTLMFNKLASDGSGTGRANIMEYPEGVVEGMLYDIDETGRAILDYYEGYPREYRRLPLTVETKTGAIAGVIAYKATEAREREGLVPPRAYLNHLLAARDVLSPTYVLEIESWLERAV